MTFIAAPYGGRSAFHVNRAIRDQRDAGLAGDRDIANLKVVHAKFGLDGLYDLQAQVDGIADRLVVRAYIGKRDQVSRWPMLTVPRS